MNKMAVYAAIGVPFLAIYILFSSMIQTTQWIWYLTRVFGLVSFFFLFFTIILGELRLLHIMKANFKWFKYHTPLGVFTLMLAVLHFISALFEKFKWGTYLTFTDYLGFSFSDKWLTFLSFGTLAFYLLILVGMTSMKKSIRSIGYKNWKLVHLLSYISFMFAFLHTVNLGTDFKTSALSVFFQPTILFCFWLVIAFLGVRILISLHLFKDQEEITLATVFFVVLLVGGALVSSFFFSMVLVIPKEPSSQVNEVLAQIKYYEQANQLVEQQKGIIANQIEVIQVVS